MNRSTQVLHRILKAKQSILAQAQKLLVSTYIVQQVTFEQVEVVKVFIDDYCQQYIMYPSLVRTWSQQLGIVTQWSSLRRVVYRYWAWNVQVVYPYFYSTFWVSSNDSYFNYLWFNTNVYTCWNTLVTLNREPRQDIQTMLTQDARDELLLPLVQTMQQVDKDNQDTED